MLKKSLFITLVILCMPFLISISHADVRKVYGEFESKEGPTYISYAKNWNKQKLMKLHEELLKNRHGKELHELKWITVEASKPKDRSGVYYETTKSIILYYGNEYKTAKDYRRILAHEYGHHVQEYYFPTTDDTKNTKWSRLRGLKKLPVHTGSSGSNEWEHQWYLAEIFAEDYKMLYGDTTKLNEREEDEDYLYYLRTGQENLQIPNVMEQPKLIAYLEKVTGWKVDKDRLLKKIHPIGVQVEKDKYRYFFTYLVMNAKQNYKDKYSVDFYQRMDFYEKVGPNTYKWTGGDRGLNFSSNDEDLLHEDLMFKTDYYSNEDRYNDKFKGVIRFTYTSIDMKTSLAVTSDPVYVYAKDAFHDFYLMNPKEVKKAKLIERKK